MQTRFGSDDERYRYARPADIDAIVEMLADEEVGQWLWFVPATPAFLRGYFQPLVDGQWQALADGRPPSVAVFIVEDPDGTFLGQGAVVEVEGSAGGYEIGFQLPKSSWGRGVGTRLAEFLVAWAVHEHEAYRLQAGCLSGNTGSRKILEKVGLKLEGTRPGYRLKADVRHDECEYGVRVEALDADHLTKLAERNRIGED